MSGRLKALDVERETKPGKYADGGGLYLIVTGPTSRSWAYRYWKDGKERWHGLDSFKDVSLKDARIGSGRCAAKGEGRSQHPRRRYRSGAAHGAGCGEAGSSLSASPLSQGIPAWRATPPRIQQSDGAAHPRFPRSHRATIPPSC